MSHTTAKKIARDNNHSFETDLNESMKKLNTLKKDFVISQPINIRYDNNTASFISKILIDQTGDTSDKCFEQSLENIQITNNRAVITHNKTNKYTSVRGGRDGEFQFLENLNFCTSLYNE